MINIKEGDIVLLNKRGWFIPEAIKLFTKHKYHHCGIVVETFGKLFVYEAVARGFICRYTLPDYIAHHASKGRGLKFIRPNKTHQLSKETLHERLNNIIGKPYDFISLVFYQLLRQLGFRWGGKKNVKAIKRIYCSEACAYIYKDIFPKWWEIDPQDISTNTHFHIVRIIND